MKLTTLSMIAIAASVAFSAVAHADADDDKWIAKCVADNTNEKQTGETVKTYCGCMNEKMGTNETASITEWEKTHKTEEEECSKKAGWTN